MSEAYFKHYDLKLIEPAFGSSLTDLIIELDFLRKKKLMGSTRPKVFFQLKSLFHILESICSARIEGNNTTLAEYIETKIEQRQNLSSEVKEIQNLEEAMSFIEENIKYPINKLYVSEMHKKVVSNLHPPPNGEGDHTPGEYRKINVKINKSSHIPPDSVKVNDYMNELLEFINNPDKPKYDLLKIAIAHHRLVWIHPFTNGNGRTVRLFTYAMLVKSGFNVNVGRILNPTAVFCGNRDDYYHYLAQADTGTEDGILSWCEYVLKGLKKEIEKIDKLLDYDYLSKEILLPSIDHSVERKYITDVESKILRLAINKQVIKAADIKNIFPGKISAEISRQIKHLLNKRMLIPEEENVRRYVLRFDNNYLLRSVIWALGEKGFLPDKDTGEL